METFLYLTYGDGKATVAIKEAKNIVELGAAFCSPEDQFEKAHGREIALKRLNEKQDFYVCFEQDKSKKLKWQAREIVNFIVSGRWVSKLDFETELDLKVSDIVTETVTDFPNDIIPITVHTNTIPTWVKRAALEKTIY